MKAAVSKIIPHSMRSTGFGIAWFLGSWLLSALYGRNVVWLVLVSVSVQFLAIAFYALCVRLQKREP